MDVLGDVLEWRNLEALLLDLYPGEYSSSGITVAIKRYQSPPSFLRSSSCSR